MSGEVVGTENAFFSGLPISYVSPDSAQVQVYMASAPTAAHHLPAGRCALGG